MCFLLAGYSRARLVVVKKGDFLICFVCFFFPSLFPASIRSSSASFFLGKSFLWGFFEGLFGVDEEGRGTEGGM